MDSFERMVKEETLKECATCAEYCKDTPIHVEIL